MSSYNPASPVSMLKSMTGRGHRPDRRRPEGDYLPGRPSTYNATSASRTRWHKTWLRCRTHDNGVGEIEGSWLFFPKIAVIFPLPMYQIVFILYRVVFCCILLYLWCIQFTLYQNAKFRKFLIHRCSRGPREKELKSRREHVSMLTWLMWWKKVYLHKILK